MNPTSIMVKIWSQVGPREGKIGLPVLHARARARTKWSDFACAETSDPQKFSKSAEKLCSGVFWGVESKNQLRIEKLIDGWAVWPKHFFSPFSQIGPILG